MSEKKEQAIVQHQGELPTVPDLVVIANNPEQMQAAQSGLVNWFKAKMQLEEQNLADCERNLKTAEEMGHNLSGWQRQVRVSRRRVAFYEKGVAALEQGYHIVPNFPIDVIAVRTNRVNPPGRIQEGNWYPQLETSAAKMGEGDFVSPDLDTRTRKVDAPTERDPERKTSKTRAVGFLEVDFPFKVVKPQVYQDFAAAMKEGVFDEIGVLPDRPHGDPMVIGRIVRKEGSYSRVVLSFLISWWVDTREL